MDLPEDFALDQPLSPFLLAALELLDPESDSFALDVISMAEATLENPRQVLRAQERAARDKSCTTPRGTMPVSTIICLTVCAAPPSTAWANPSCAVSPADR